MKCDYPDCPEDGGWLVRLNDPDGTFEQNLCGQHADEFEDWVNKEVARLGGELATVRAWTHEERSS